MISVISMRRLTPTKHPYALAQTARKIFFAAAFGSLSGSRAFLSPLTSVPPATSSGHPSPLAHRSKFYPIPPPTVAQHRHPRLFFSQKDGNDWETFKRSGGNLLKKGADKLKSLMPFSKSEEEKRAAIVKKETKNQIKSMLKDLPLPIRMIGRMVAPLLAQAAGEIVEQSKQAENLLEEARICLANDPILAEMLGEPLQVGQPFSQSSSTTVINGESSTRLQARFEVAGTNGTVGIATMEANDGEIRSLTVNVNGRIISVSSRRGGGVFGKSSSKKDDNIIEAEIIEKK